MTPASGEFPSIRKQPGAYMLATLGVLVILVEIVLHVWAVFTSRQYELNHWVLILGVVLGYAGFYRLNSKLTSSGFKILVDGSTEILSRLPRFGRRATDAVAVPSTETKVTAIPAPDIPTAPTTPDADGGKGGTP